MCVPCDQCKLIIIYSTTPHGSFSERKLKLVTAITSKKNTCVFHGPAKKVHFFYAYLSCMTTNMGFAEYDFTYTRALDSLGNKRGKNI